MADAGGERGAVEEMARAMSAVLTAMRIVHQLELYNMDDRERERTSGTGTAAINI